MWKNNVSSFKMKTWKKISQKNKEKGYFPTISLPHVPQGAAQAHDNAIVQCAPAGTPCASGTWLRVFFFSVLSFDLFFKLDQVKKVC